jgi:anaerobic selenocysteine-containing dehydrogenase
MTQGTKLIVVDPRETRHASMADLWLQLRPASDLALALAMINVVITERLYDDSFVQTWTVGFDELVQHIQDYTPQWAEEITWVPAHEIRVAARMYSEIKPASIRPGNGIDDTINSVQTARAISILRTITGNLAVPGGDGDWSLLPSTKEEGFILSDELSNVQRQKMLGTERKPGADGDALPQLVARAILEEKPYPVKVMCIHGSNPLLTWSNSKEAYDALMKLDFLSVADLIMTPTAELADIVLPVTSFLEVDDVVFSPPRIKVRRRVVEPIAECWPDRKILNELAKKLGFGRYFWNDVEESLDVRLKPAGCTFSELKKIGSIKASRVYRDYERHGFNTPSGKAEIYSSLLGKYGHDPLPIYREPPETPRSAPELSKEYPLILTSHHSPFYYHSANRHLSTLRSLESEPCVEINPKTAAKLGIRDRDLVWIETQRGRIQQRAVITESIDPRVVNVSYAWWFPEQGEVTLHGWRQSNINILTDSAPPYNPEVGSTNLRGIFCRVYKAAR